MLPNVNTLHPTEHQARYAALSDADLVHLIGECYRSQQVPGRIETVKRLKAELERRYPRLGDLLGLSANQVAARLAAWQAEVEWAA